MMKITFALVAGLLLASTSAMSEMGYQLAPYPSHS
jgi:hypothetical protein